MYDIDQLMDGIEKNDRRSLAKAITLVESTKPEHTELANQLLCKILDHRANHPKQQRNLQEWLLDDEYIKSKQIPTYDDVQKQNEFYPKLLHRHKPIPAILQRVNELRNGKPSGPLIIGVSGTPGVGKSTFLEHFGMHLIDKYNLKIAVLSIDPSSLITGGSILGLLFMFVILSSLFRYLLPHCIIIIIIY
jgi:pantothenate kinase